jgi:outer membrane lipoprotein-sorting protein
MLIMEIGDKKPKQYEATFSNWDINPFLPDAMFKFQIPPKAKKISILPRK